MRKKAYVVLNKLYGIMMSISFFAGFLPIFPFIYAIIVGGTQGENISNFLYQDYFPVVIIIGSLSILIGLIAMYIGKLEGLSVKNVTTSDEQK